jgi:hypothetical protein
VAQPLALTINQTFRTPAAEVDKVTFDRVGGGVINVLYDLKSDDPGATFSIALEVSQDGGQTYALKPQSVSGDIGANVSPGTGKKIVWEASKDVDLLLVDRFRFRVTPSSGTLKPIVEAPRVGALTITTEPPGAAVAVDGVARGQTPLRLTELPAGTHRVSLTRSDYLENAATVEIKAGETATIDRTLTKATVDRTPPPAKASGGGSPMKWVIPVVAGGAVGAAVAAKSGGGSSTPATPAAPPTAVLNMTASPNPAPWNGAATLGGPCTGSTNTWFYDTTIVESGGVSVHLTHAVDRHSGVGFGGVVNDAPMDQTVAARGSLTFHAGWCWTPPVASVMETTFSGTDANNHAISVSVFVNLVARPGFTSLTSAFVAPLPIAGGGVRWK